MKDTVVSIICNTYNQENYIKDALESFLMQETDFAFEVLVHDDASTDRTPQIIDEYARKYPDIIKPYYEDINRYTIGGKYTFLLQAARARGEYIALCEGDDYWTDSHKLQLQYEVLEKHQEVDVCVHWGEKVDADTKEQVGIVRPKAEDCIIPIEDVIKGGGDYVLTNSIFMRADTFKYPPKAVVDFHLDYMYQISSSMRGGMYYIDRCMSAYRVAAKGSFSSSTLKSRAKKVETMRMVIDSLCDLDSQTNHTFTVPIRDHVDELEYRCNSLCGRVGEALRTNAWKSKSIFSKVKDLSYMLYSGLLYQLEMMKTK